MKKSPKKIKHIKQHKKTKAVAKLKRRQSPRGTATQARTQVKAKGETIDKGIGKAVQEVVRIMGMGQFTVDARTLKRLNGIDDSLVEMVAAEKADDAEFKKGMVELSSIVVKHGKPVERGEIVRSDIILPSVDLPVDEAKKLFRGEGVIPAA